MANRYEDRTNQKLRFAERYLRERLRSRNTGEDRERADEECFFFHLIGAKDSFLQEINYALGLGVPVDQVRERTLRAALKKGGKACQPLDEIERLKNTDRSWLNLAIYYRNHGTHRANIGRVLYARAGIRDPRGGDDADRIAFKYPNSQEEMKENVSEFLSTCFEDMKRFITRLRTTLHSVSENK